MSCPPVSKRGGKPLSVQGLDHIRQMNTERFRMHALVAPVHRPVIRTMPQAPLWKDADKDPLYAHAFKKCVKNHKEFQGEEEKVALVLDEICTRIKYQEDTIRSMTSQGQASTKDDAAKFLKQVASEIDMIDAELAQHCEKLEQYSYDFHAGLATLRRGAQTTYENTKTALTAHEEEQREQESGRRAAFQTLQGDAGAATKIGGFVSYVGKTWAVTGCESSMNRQYQIKASLDKTRKNLLDPMRRLQLNMENVTDRLQHLQRMVQTVNGDYESVINPLTRQFEQGRQASFALLKEEHVERVLMNLQKVIDSARNVYEF